MIDVNIIGISTYIFYSNIFFVKVPLTYLFYYVLKGRSKPVRYSTFNLRTIVHLYLHRHRIFVTSKKINAHKKVNYRVRTYCTYELDSQKNQNFITVPYGTVLKLWTIVCAEKCTLNSDGGWESIHTRYKLYTFVRTVR